MLSLLTLLIAILVVLPSFVSAGLFEMPILPVPVIGGELSAPAKLCLDNIRTVHDAVAAYQKDFEGFNSATDGYKGALALHKKIGALKDQIQKVETDCCAITSVSINEASQTIKEITSLVSTVASCLNTMITKKMDFQEYLEVSKMASEDIQDIQKQVKPIATCLLKLTPMVIQTPANTLYNQLDAAFSSAVNNFASRK